MTSELQVREAFLVRPFVWRHWDSIVLIVLSLCTLTWFGTSGIDLNVDSFFMLRPDFGLADSLTAWSTRLSAGAPNFSVNSFGAYLIEATLTKFFGLRIAEMLTVYSLFAAGAIGFKWFLEQIIDRRDAVGKCAMVVGAFIYVANPFTLSYVWWHQTWMEFTWVLMPILFAFVLICSTAPELPLRIYGWTLILLTVFAAAFPHVYVVVITPMMLSIAFSALVNAKPKNRYYVALLLIACVAGVGWWIVPGLPAVKLFLAQWKSLYGASPQVLLHNTSLNTGVLEVARLIGLDHLYQSVNTQPYVAWAKYYTEGPLGICSYALPIVSIAGAFLIGRDAVRDRVRPVQICMIAFCVLGLFLMKGDHEPLASFNRALLRVPFGAAFQHPYDKFALWAVPAMCVLFTIGLIGVFDRLRGRGRLAMMVGLAVIAVISESSPAFTGTVFPQDGPNIVGAMTEVPPEYEEIAQRIPRSQGKILQLPDNEDGSTAFRWVRGAQTNNDPVLEYFAPEQSVIRIDSGYAAADALLDEADGSVLSARTTNATLALLGFNAVVVHRDWDEDYIKPRHSIEHLISVLDSESDAPKYQSAYAAGDQREFFISRALNIKEKSDVRFSVRIDRPGDKTIFTTANYLAVKWNAPGYFGLVQVPTGPGEKMQWLPAPISSNPRDVHNVHIHFEGGTATLEDNGVVEAQGAFRPHVGRTDVIVGAKGSGASGLATTDITDGTDVTLPPDVQRNAKTAGWIIRSLAPQHNGGTHLEKTDVGRLSIYRVRCATPIAYIANAPYQKSVLDAAVLYEKRIATSGCNAHAPAAVEVGVSERRRGNFVVRNASTRGANGDIALNGSGHGILVFNTSYNDGWVAKSSSSKVKIGSHVLVNGYANGFEISGSGPARIALRFLPQRFVTIAAVCGLLLFLAGLILVISSKTSVGREPRQVVRL